MDKGDKSALSLVLTPRAADTASPWPRRGGWSGEVASPAVAVGRRRRAADAIVGQGRKRAEGEKRKRKRRGQMILG